MDANIGCSSPLLSTHFLFKTWTLSEEYRSWVEDVCHWLYSWHFNVTFDNTYIHICIYQRNLWNCPCWRTFSLSLDWSFMLMFSRWQLLRNYRILTDDKCLGIIIFGLLFSLILISKWTTLQHMNSPRLHKTFFMGDSIFSALYIHNMVIYTGIFVVQTRHETSCLDFVQYTTNLIIRCIVIMVEKYLKRSTKIFWEIFLIPATKVSIFRTSKYTQNWKRNNCITIVTGIYANTLLCICTISVSQEPICVSFTCMSLCTCREHGRALHITPILCDFVAE